MNGNALTRLAYAASLIGLLPALVRGQILSTKRGFADTGASYSNLQAVNAGWYYTWGTGSASPGNFDANFYPMFWNAPSQTTINGALARNPLYMLGFNEPERLDQANMTVAQAISSWTTISSSTIAYNNANGTNIKLVSPAVSDTGGAGGGQQWLASFMSQANSSGLKIDAVAFHWYGVSTPDNPAGAASSFLSRVDSYHNSYGLPVFITEFAIHDWGGNYTDAQIIEANRQFLNIVIPALESRSYVAGYSWYNWFSDSPLYTTASGVLTPTQMGWSYIGAVGSGATTDIGGMTLGEHVADLTGGTLTMTSAGTVRYIDALANTSIITGSIDWSLDSSSTNGWIRVQSGATLRKTGTNSITLGSGSISNSGVIEVADGVLRLGSLTASGTGSILISSTGGATGSTARLELSGNVYAANAITFAQRNDPTGSDGIRNVSGNNTLAGAMTITVGGNQARLRSDAGLLTLGPITTDATTARNLYLQGAGNGAVGGAISDNASNAAGQINVWKEGSGTWTLSGANTYTGTTNVSAGTLGFAASPSHVGSVTVADNAGLRVGAAGPASTALTATSLTLGASGATTLTFDFDSLDTTAPLISTGSFTVNGTANVSLQNGGALSSGTHALVGYTSIGGAGTLAGSTFVLGPRSSGTLINNGTSALSLNVTADRPIWTGSDNGNWVAGATGASKNWKLQSASTATDYLEGDNVLFDDSAPGTGAVNINAANVAPAATTFNNSSKSYNVTSSGSFGITGTGPVTKDGTGTVTLSTPNSYTGTTTINAGTLSISTNGNLGASGAPVTLSGGTLKTTNSGLFTNTHPVTIAAGGGTININSTGSGGKGQLYFNTPNTLLGTGPLTVTGSGTLATTGAGNLRITQTNPYTGNITLQSGGSFEYGAAGAVAGVATFTLNNQGEIISNNLTVPNNLTVGGGTSSVLSFANGTAGSYSGSITLNANATAALRDWYSPGTVRGGAITGQISGSGGLIVNSGTGSGGLLTLSAANTYSGGTTISASKVLAGTSAALGTGPVSVGGTGAQLQLASGVNVANPITINGSAGSTAQGIIWVPTTNASATVSGPITINAVQAAGGHFAANGGTLTVSGPVTSSVPVTARIGTVVFSNTGSSYTQLNVQQGTVRIGASNAIPVGASVDLGASGAASFDLSGFNQTLAGLTKNTNGATVTNSGGALSTLTTTGTYTYAGVIQNGTSAVRMTVNGGTATLTGANTYSGGTTVSAGTLRVNGSIAGAATIGSGGTLQGTGSIGGLVTVQSGGTLAPGSSLGLLSIGSLSLNAGSQTQIELGGTTRGSQYDAILAGGNSSLGGALNVSLINGFVPVLGSSFDILDWTAESGGFSSVSVPALPAGLAWNTRKLYSTGSLSVIDANYLPGDLDRDGHFDVADISAMMHALVDLDDYQATSGPGGGPLMTSQLLQIADFSDDGVVTNADMQGLINYLAGGNGAGTGALSAVPEPTSLALAASAIICVTACVARERHEAALFRPASYEHLLVDSAR